MKVVFLLAVMWSASLAFAKPKLDLSRITPAPADQPVPVVDFFRSAILESPQINPAGQRVAALHSRREDAIELMIFDLARNKQSRLSAGNQRDIGSFRWLDDRRIAFNVGALKRYAYGLYVADTTDLRGNIAINAYDVTQLVGVPKSNPLQPLVWLRRIAKDQAGGVVQFDATREVRLEYELVETDAVNYIAAARTNDGENILVRYPAPSGGTVEAYLANVSGDLEFGVTVDRGVASLHRWDGGRWSKCPADLDEVDLCSVGEKAGEVLVAGPRQPGKPRPLQRLDAIAGELGEVLHQDTVYDITAESFHIRESDGRLLGVNCQRDGPRTIWLEPSYRELQAKLDQMMPSWILRVTDMDRTGRRLIVRATSDRHPGQYFLCDAENPELVPLGNCAPWIDPGRMQPRRLLSYKSRDGVDIEAYLTLPAKNAGRTRPPLVVLPHGGPWVRDVWGWDAEAQFLASRGYAVFQPNYRGSTGFRWRFPKADEWDFTAMHRDVTDGVRLLIKAGVVDQERIAIMGSSFGAYLALCGAANEPGLYRCAVGISGVYDWEQVLRETRSDDHYPERYGVLKRFLGDPREHADKYAAISPLRRAAQIRIPVFVAHGADDPVADVEQSQNLVRELKKHGVPHQVLIRGEEGHVFERLGNTVELYTAIEAFLGRRLASRGGGDAE